MLVVRWHAQNNRFNAHDQIHPTCAYTAQYRQKLEHQQHRSMRQPTRDSFDSRHRTISGVLPSLTIPPDVAAQLARNFRTYVSKNSLTDDGNWGS
jgi:hypothetical protein